MLEEYWIEQNWIDRSTLVMSDARLLRFAACMYDDCRAAEECGVRREDLVPQYMDNEGFTKARDVALAFGWIVKNPEGPIARGSRYYGNWISPDACLEHDALRLHNNNEVRIVAEFHHDLVQEVMMSMPGKSFTSRELCRIGGGTCTDVTWPLIRNMLNDDDDIEKYGKGRGRRYAYNGCSNFNHAVARRAVRRPWGELAPDYYLSDFMTGGDAQGKGVA